MLKKLLIMMLCLCMVGTMAACGEEPEDNTLEVYYLKTDPAAAEIIKKSQTMMDDVELILTAFDDVHSMDLQVAAKLSSDQGPDVILFSDSTALDTAKLAAEGKFLDISTMMNDDGDFIAADYYPVLDCGNMDGHQYFLPLRMKVPYLISTQERMEGLPLPEEYTMQDLMKAITAKAESCGDGESALHRMYQQSAGALLYDYLRLTGVQIVDESLKETVITDEVLQEYAGFSQLAYGQIDKSANILKANSRDFVAGVSKLTALALKEPLPINLRYYTAIYDQAMGETAQLLVLPGMQDSTALTVDIPLYGAIVKGTKNPNLAYRFLKRAMNTPTDDLTQDLPVSKAVVQSQLDILTNVSGKRTNIGSMYVSIPTMSAETRTVCEQTLDKIASGSIRNYGLQSICADAFEGYIMGKEDYQTALDAFKNQLAQYVSG